MQDVIRWMEQEPLQFLPQCLQPGLVEFLHVAKQRRVRLGVLSITRPRRSSRLWVLQGSSTCVVRTDAVVNAFKPDPRGLLVALERLGATRTESLYIGDRVDVDAAMAEAAGVRCAIVTSRPSAGGSHVPVTDFSQLGQMLWP